nr:MAG: RNA-dependent RNA polymerase [Riboviria sp.]
MSVSNLCETSLNLICNDLIASLIVEQCGLSFFSLFGKLKTVLNCSTIRDAIRSLQIRLRDVSQRFETDIARPEPVVIYISGPRGCGKSILSLALATVLCKRLGLDPHQNIYSKSPDISYWDGYCGQKVCILDDIGQCTDDEDWTYFCQLVSTVPYILDMASLEDKGMPFTSPFVICTSNIDSPQPSTIHFKEALERRLTFKVKVQTKDYYKCNSGEYSVLNLTRAKMDGSIKDLSCLELFCDKVITFDQLVEAVFENYLMKTNNVRDMIEIWAQGGSDDFSLLVHQLTRPKKMPSLFEMIRENKFLILSSVGAILTACGLIYAGMKLFRRSTDSNSAYNPGPLPKKVVLVDQQVTSQSICDVSTLVQKNLVKVGTSPDGQTVSWRLNGLGLNETTFVMPAHGLKYSDDCKFLFVVRNNVTYVCPLDKLVVIDCEQCSDLVFVNFPGIPPFRDIRSHFVKESQLELCKERLATLATYNQGLFQLIGEGSVKFLDGTSYIHSDDKGEKHEIWIPRVWKGAGESARGSCGGVLISSSVKVGTPFIGIHVAGGGGKLISALLTQEMIANSVAVMSNSTRIMQIVESGVSLPLNSKSEIRASPLQEFYDRPVTKRPSQPLYSRQSQIVVNTRVYLVFLSQVYHKTLEVAKL